MLIFWSFAIIVNTWSMIQLNTMIASLQNDIQLLTPKIGTGRNWHVGRNWQESIIRQELPSTHSVRSVCGRECIIIRQRAIPRLKVETFGSAWWRGLNIKKETSCWWIRNRHDVMLWVLGSKYCNRSWLGVMLGTGYKYKPLVFVIGIEQFHNKPAPCHFRVLLVVPSSSSRGAIDPSTSVSTGNLVSCLVSCGGFRPWCK
jgi:hypothetical protein